MQKHFKIMENFEKQSIESDQLSQDQRRVSSPPFLTDFLSDFDPPPSPRL